MDKFERILEVPACYISREVADHLSQRIQGIAEEQADADYEQRLRQMAPGLGMTPEEALEKHRDEPFWRLSLRVRKDRTTFISPSGNVEFSGRLVLYPEIPHDPAQIIIDVPGIEGKYLNISLTTDLMATFPLHAVNKILIQGYDRGWVNSLYEEWRSQVDQGRKVVRDLVYRWLRPIGYLGFLALSFLEFRLFQLIQPSFTILTPLSGLAVLLVFSLLLANYYIVFSVGGRAIRYVYPYFELEDRLSEKRKDLRKWWVITVAAVYSGGVWALISTLVS